MLGMSAAPTPSPQPAAGTGMPAADASSAVAATGDAATQGDSMPFAAVLGQQMNPSASQDASATVSASVVTALSADPEAPTEAPTDAISVLASMLAGIAVPAQPTAESSNSDDPQAATTADLTTDPAAMATIAPPIAMPTVSTPTPVASSETADASAKTAAPDASMAAIVAAGRTGKAEGAAEGGKSASEMGRLTSELAKSASDANKGTSEAGKSASDMSKFADLLAARTAQPNNEVAATRIGGSGAETAAAAAAHAMSKPAHGSDNASHTAIPVATPVGAEGWNQEVGEKLSWMVGRQETHAELVLNPPQLGRVEVSLSLKGDQATATFVSANPAVRDALENAIPHLRETLESAGISLGQTQVGAESFQQAANQRENGDNSARGGNRGNDAAANVVGAAASGQTSPAQWLRRGNGLVDTFA